MIAPRPALEALRRVKLRTDARWRPPRLPRRARSARPLDIAIVGAGVAGLATAHLLRNAGHRAHVLEAQHRPGGRIRTLRAFDEGLWAEAGAFRIADEHLFTRRWVHDFGLHLEPVYPAHGHLIGEHEAGPVLTEDARWISAHRFHHLLTGHTCAQRTAEGRGRRLVHEALKKPAWSRIAGGMDRLPRAMAEALGPASLRYCAPVHAVDQRGEGVRIMYTLAGRERADQFDRVVMAAPLPTLAGIRFTPGLGALKRDAAETVTNAEAFRFVYQLRDRGWLPAGACGYGVTQEGTELWQPSFGHRGERSLLVLAAQGHAAAQFTDQAADERAHRAKRRAQAMFPEIVGRIEREAQVCWREDLWARGAQSRVDQADIDRTALGAAEGRVHFAGEFTANNWIDGALRSAHRVAAEIEPAIACARDSAPFHVAIPGPQSKSAP
ncbi:MAG: NAD(P)/FAD-dependent oxidoreductase [Halofilum sp. (in: g-proteobacteria)]